MTQTAVSQADQIYALLCSYIDVLGAPVLALYGLNSDGHCSCPKGAECGKNAGKHPNAKLCPKGLNSASTDKKQIRRWVDNHPNLNWGICTGKPLPSGGYLIVLDCDPRNGSEETIEDAEKEFGELPRTPTQLTGGGGQHLLLRVPSEMPTSTCGAGLDRKGLGGYIVVEPSRHYSGKLYVWDAIRDLEMPIADAPAWIAEGKKTAPRPPWTGAKAVDSIIGHAFKAAGWIGHEISEGRHTVYCPWASLHTDGRGKGGDASTVILPPTKESSAGGFCCQHSHCKDKSWKDAMATLPADAQIAARKAFTVVTDPIVTDAGTNIDLVARVTADLSPEDLHFVRSKLLYTTRKDGKSQIIKKDLVNVSAILKHDPRWAGLLSYDNFAHQIYLNKEPLWAKDDVRGGFEPVYPRQWADDDDIRTRLWLSRYWGMEWDRQSVNDAVVTVAQANGVHPVRSYLRSLEWDGKERVDSWLLDYCGVGDSEYARNVGRWWLVSAIARVMNPGCKADHVLILEGAQGIGKSTVFQVLGGKWVCDSTLTLGDKEAYQLIKGRWIIELAELDSLSKSDTSRAKAFFTSPTDTYRPSYGRATITVPRQCVFAGTVNHGQFLRDETGNRRYWPVLCERISTLALQADRDQLWAEALRLYNSGARWWPAGLDEVMECSQEQAQREMSDEWEVVIDRWLSGPDAVHEIESAGHITTAVVLEKALRIEAARWSPLDMSRVAKAMQRLRWRKHLVKGMWAFKK